VQQLCIISKKWRQVDVFHNTFQSQKSHQAKPECTPAPLESQSASSTGSVTNHAISAHKVGMTLNTSVDNISITPSSRTESEIDVLLGLQRKL